MSACGGSTSSAQMTGPTSTSEQAGTSCLRPSAPAPQTLWLLGTSHLPKSGDTFVTSQMVILYFLTKWIASVLTQVCTPSEQAVSMSLEPSFLGSWGESMNEIGVYVRAFVAVFIFMGVDYL